MTVPASVEQLAALDSLMPRTYIRALLVFEQTEPTLPIPQKLQSGLDRLSKQLPWLAGRVFEKASAQESAFPLGIRWGANETPTLIDKGTTSISYQCALSHGFSTEAISSNVWPVPAIPDQSATGAPVFAASLFRFADQGLGLCVGMHHSAVDGFGLSEIMRLWALNVADAEFQFSASSQNRSERLLEALSSDLQEASSFSSEMLFARHPEYSKLPPVLPKQLLPCTSKLFTISMNWIDVLKQLVQKYTQKTPTTNTVICALIWTTITRVRMQDNPSLKTKTSRLAMAVNGRQRISQSFSLPESPYFGNVVLYSLSNFPAGTLAACDEAPMRSIARVCDHIAQSQARSAINSRHVAEVYHPDRMENPGSLFVGWDLFGSRDVTITNWADIGLYEVDFGDVLGQPKCVSLPYMEADGVAIILPRQRAASPQMLDIMIMLRRDHMKALDSNPMWQMLLSTGV